MSEPTIKTRKRSRVCATCQSAHPTGHAINGVELVECRRRAPVAVYGDMRARRAYFPTLLADEWCGEHVTRS